MDTTSFDAKLKGFAMALCMDWDVFVAGNLPAFPRYFRGMPSAEGQSTFSRDLSRDLSNSWQYLPPKRVCQGGGPLSFARDFPDMVVPAKGYSPFLLIDEISAYESVRNFLGSSLAGLPSENVGSQQRIPSVLSTLYCKVIPDMLMEYRGAGQGNDETFYENLPMYLRILSREVLNTAGSIPPVAARITAKILWSNSIEWQVMVETAKSAGVPLRGDDPLFQTFGESIGFFKGIGKLSSLYERLGLDSLGRRLPSAINFFTEPCYDVFSANRPYSTTWDIYLHHFCMAGMLPLQKRRNQQVLLPSSDYLPFKVIYKDYTRAVGSLPDNNLPYSVIPAHTPRKYPYGRLPASPSAIHFKTIPTLYTKNLVDMGIERNKLYPVILSALLSKVVSLKEGSECALPGGSSPWSFTRILQEIYRSAGFSPSKEVAELSATLLRKGSTDDLVDLAQALAKDLFKALAPVQTVLTNPTRKSHINETLIVTETAEAWVENSAFIGHNSAFKTAVRSTRMRSGKYHRERYAGKPEPTNPLTYDHRVVLTQVPLTGALMKSLLLPEMRVADTCVNAFGRASSTPEVRMLCRAESMLFADEVLPSAMFGASGKLAMAVAKSLRDGTALPVRTSDLESLCRAAVDLGEMFLSRPASLLKKGLQAHRPEGDFVPPSIFSAVGGDVSANPNIRRRILEEVILHGASPLSVAEVYAGKASTVTFAKTTVANRVSDMPETIRESFWFYRGDTLLQEALADARKTERAFSSWVNNMDEATLYGLLHNASSSLQDKARERINLHFQLPETSRALGDSLTTVRRLRSTVDTPIEQEYATASRLRNAVCAAAGLQEYSCLWKVLTTYNRAVPLNTAFGEVLSAVFPMVPDGVLTNLANAETVSDVQAKSVFLKNFGKMDFLPNSLVQGITPEFMTWENIAYNVDPDSTLYSPGLESNKRYGGGPFGVNIHQKVESLLGAKATHSGKKECLVGVLSNLVMFGGVLEGFDAWYTENLGKSLIDQDMVTNLKMTQVYTDDPYPVAYVPAGVQKKEWVEYVDSLSYMHRKLPKTSKDWLFSLGMYAACNETAGIRMTSYGTCSVEPSELERRDSTCHSVQRSRRHRALLVSSSTFNPYLLGLIDQAASFPLDPVNLVRSTMRGSLRSRNHLRQSMQEAIRGGKAVTHETLLNMWHVTTPVLVPYAHDVFVERHAVLPNPEYPFADILQKSVSVEPAYWMFKNNSTELEVVTRETALLRVPRLPGDTWDYAPVDEARLLTEGVGKVTSVGISGLFTDLRILHSAAAQSQQVKPTITSLRYAEGYKYLLMKIVKGSS
jgi:hypothetical protein